MALFLVTSVSLRSSPLDPALYKPIANAICVDRVLAADNVIDSQNLWIVNQPTKLISCKNRDLVLGSASFNGRHVTTINDRILSQNHHQIVMNCAENRVELELDWSILDYNLPVFLSSDHNLKSRTCDAVVQLNFCDLFSLPDVQANLHRLFFYAENNPLNELEHQVFSSQQIEEIFPESISQDSFASNIADISKQLKPVPGMFLPFEVSGTHKTCFGAVHLQTDYGDNVFSTRIYVCDGEYTSCSGKHLNRIVKFTMAETGELKSLQRQIASIVNIDCS